MNEETLSHVLAQFYQFNRKKSISIILLNNPTWLPRKLLILDYMIIDKIE